MSQWPAVAHYVAVALSAIAAPDVETDDLTSASFSLHPNPTSDRDRFRDFRLCAGE
jgi:hypothetical protein